MHLAFTVEAAKPKGNRADADAPAQEPMRGSTKQVRKNPSSDQKRTRRKLQRAATRTDMLAGNLSGGEYIRGPNGQTFQIHHVSPYARDPSKVLLHFQDGAAMAVGRNDPQEVVPGNQNMTQRELPNEMGQVGGNFNYLPMTPHGAPSGAGRGMSPGSLTQDRACPQDGTQMQVHGNGEMICPRCGFKSFVGMAEGHSFMADPAQAIPKNPSGSVAPRRMAALDHRCTICQGVLVDKGSDASGTVASCADCGTRHSITTDAAVLDFDTFGAPKPTASTAIARRAREVLAQEGTHDQ